MPVSFLGWTSPCDSSQSRIISTSRLERSGVGAKGRQQQLSVSCWQAQSMSDGHGRNPDVELRHGLRPPICWACWCVWVHTYPTVCMLQCPQRQNQVCTEGLPWPGQIGWLATAPGGRPAQSMATPNDILFVVDILRTAPAAEESIAAVIEHIRGLDQVREHSAALRALHRMCCTSHRHTDCV